MSWDVLGIGANSVDYVYRLPAYPERDGPNAKMRISSHTLSCGGQVATALCTSAAMGLSAKYVGATGTDDNGRRIRDELARRGIDMTDAVIRDVTNQFAVIMVDERAGERIVLWDRHDGLRLRPRELPEEVITSARVVHVDDVDQEAAIRAARVARAAGLTVTSDIDRITNRTEELVEAVTIPMFAEHVPVALTGEADFERALRKLRQRHAGLLCVTIGSRGAVILDGDRFHHEPAFQVEAVDTTGAGDVFRGAFIAAMLRGDAPADIVRFANAAAGASCTRLGAINGVPTFDEAARLMQHAVVRG
jgi:sugar/nucleoside kinase (ribokinase family)